MAGQRSTATGISDVEDRVKPNVSTIALHGMSRTRRKEGRQEERKDRREGRRREGKKEGRKVERRYLGDVCIACGMPICNIIVLHSSLK